MMAVVNVEIPDVIAKKINTSNVIKYDDLEDIIEKSCNTVVDFWKEWVPISKVLSYLKSK